LGNDITVRINCVTLQHCWGTRWRSRLRHYVTIRKVAGSIPDGVIGIFHRHNPSGRTMVLDLTQSLTEMITRIISWGYRRPVRRADKHHLRVPIVLKSGSLNLLELPGSAQACNWFALPLPYNIVWFTGMVVSSSASCVKKSFFFFVKFYVAVCHLF
jgi:hypothetical protein